jgi:hypothetical protein
VVEHNLAKVGVASSSLVSRSSFWGKQSLQVNANRNPALPPKPRFPFSFARQVNRPVRKSAGWQSGHAAACKAVDAGSIPTPASK